MTEHRIPVKAWLKPETFLELERHAAQRETTVGGLLEQLADASLRPLTPRPPRDSTHKLHVRLDERQRDEVRALRKIGWSLAAIAREYGIDRKTALNITRETP